MANCPMDGLAGECFDLPAGGFEAPAFPRNVYALSKQAGEQMLSILLIQWG